MTHNLRKAFLAVIPFLVILFFFLFFRDQVQAFDTSITHFVVDQRNTVADAYFNFVTTLANEEFMTVVIISFVLLIGFHFKEWKTALSYGIAIVLGNLVLNPILKELIQRSRPDEALRMVSETTYSFPSGHSFASGMIYPLITYFFLRSTKLGKHTTLVNSILVLVMVSICFSRIYLGVHYFTDVIAGFSLGLFCYYLTRHVFENTL